MEPDDSGSGPVGRTLGHYTVEARLGGGGMGEVYRARDTRLDRLVAIKLLPEDVADADRLRRFQLEARATSALNHPHILVIYDVGDIDGRPFIVTELVEGETLRQKLRGQPVGVREAIDIAVPIANALAAAHARGIVHRDIKPENIMIRPDGVVKVLDFGLAKLSLRSELSDETTLATGPGVMMGTPEYMSPEQASGEAVDFRSDQFAFGVLMYELLSGHRPFRRGSAVLTAAAVITESPSPLARVCPDLPPPLWWAIERCLAKRREDRFASTDQLYRDLLTIQARLSDVHLPASSLPSSNLPAAASSLIGRQADTGAIRALLERADVRWVTLTGPGGVGKTRLAVHVARELNDLFARATYFVPMARFADPDQLISSLSLLFEVRPTGGETTLDALIRHFRALASPILLVLDNFEHVASAAVPMAELLQRCEQVEVLATSRARLNVSAEHEYQVSPLAIPDSRLVRRAALAADVPAVQLFVERARSARAGFTLTDENASAITEICHVLDGLPLAIELAAARVKVLPPDALLARISGRTLSLDGGARDLPARQQTLRATIDWSYELLTPGEQRLFSRLGVFVGGWTFESAEAVCDARQDLGVDVFDGIASLVEKSLVRSLDTGQGEPRFIMLSTLKQYALERLAVSGEAAATRQAHAAYCLVLAEDAGSEAVAQASWLALCEQEHGNIRGALDYLFESKQAAWAMRLASALLPFWQGRALLQEGRDALVRALALAPDDERSTVRARALFAVGAIVHPMGDPEGCAAYARQALGIYRALNDRDGQAVALNAMGVAFHRMQRYDEARRAFDEAVAIWRELGREQATVRTLANLASVALDAGDAEDAIALYRETRTRCQHTGDVAAVAWAISGEARVEQFRDNGAAAAQLYETALQTFESIQDSWGAGDSLLSLGIIAGEAGEERLARERLERALAIFRQVKDVRGTLRIVEAAAYLSARAGAAERALTLAGAAAASRRTLNVPLPAAAQARLEAVLDEARRTLDPARAGSAWMRGWSLSPEAAIELAFD